jgi:hypothetical protein
MSVARPRALVAGSLLLCCSAILLVGCSSAAGGSSTSSIPAGPVPSSVGAPSQAAGPTASPAPSGDTDVAIGPGSGLPDTWPSQLPAPDGGQLASAVVADGGANINAAWTTDASIADAFAAMDSALEANGFVSYKDSGADDMYVETEDMRSDNYATADFDVNLTVASNGGQTTVLLNASRI